MITVTKLASGQLGIRSHVYYSKRLKAIPTARWDPIIKQWTIESFALGTLEERFKGEIVYKTPRWVLLNQPMPDMSAMYEIDNKSIVAPTLKLQPYDYQNYGIRFMIDKLLKNNFVINADDVGLGKTIQTIGVLKWFIENKGLERIIIICKKSIKKQWKDEIDKFTDISKDFWIGYTKDDKKTRKKVYSEFKAHNKAILITNYHTFLNDESEIKSLSVEFSVIDEVHSVKGIDGKIHNAIARVIKGLPTVFLTGTPIMSKPQDIYGVVHISDEKYFGNWGAFSKKYIVYDNLNYNYGIKPMIVGAKNLDELREKIHGIIIRRTPYEVSIQLPSVNLIRINCELDNTQLTLMKAINDKYKEYMERKEAVLKMPEITQSQRERKVYILNAIDAASKGLLAAKQAVANDPNLFAMSNSKMMKEEFGSLVPKTYDISSKTQVILDTVEDIMQSDNKVILFSKFRTSAIFIGNTIKKKLKCNVLLYTGSENQDTRDKNIDLFKNTDTHNILIGTEAMAEGLNLETASYVINIDQPDTFAIKTQRIGRARRASSTFNSITVYDMITVGSKDEERLENISKNIDLTDALINIDDAQRVALINAMKKAV